jgi:glycosyltransferase involved in cell wall biosynthesis
VRFLDFAEHEDLSEMTLGAKQIIDARIAGTSVYANRVETLLRPHLEWADTVLVEGALAPAAMFTLIDPGDTRMMVRWHGGETYGLWPHLTDWSRIDDVVFEADHVRDLAVDVVPRLAPMRLSTVASALTLRGLMPRPKPADARFTVGMVGVGGVAKDPRWAVEVLRRLRERDDRYRLLLLGDDLDPELNYVDDYDERLGADLVAAGEAVHRHTIDDLPAQLAEVGVILNASVREGFPRSLVLGAASGAVPIVRDWPFFAGRAHGAHTLLPTDWVVDTPEQAADRIVKLTASEDIWRDAGRAAAEHAVSTWDFTETRHAFDDLLGV